MARRISKTTSSVGCQHTSVLFIRPTITTTTAWWIMWIAVALKCQPHAKRAAITPPFAVAWSSSSSLSHWNHPRHWKTTKRERRHERRFVSLPHSSKAAFSKKGLATTTFTSSSSLFLSSSTSASSSRQEDNVTTTTSNEFLTKNWREDPRINPTLTVPTILVPSQEMHRWIKDDRLHTHKLSLDSHPLLPHIHPRIKLVQDFQCPSSSSSDGDNDASSHPKKRILLSPDTTKEHLQDLELEWGPPYEMNISYKQLSFSYILNQLIPKQYASSSYSYSQNDEGFHYEFDDQYNAPTTNITSSDNNKNDNEPILLPPPSAYEQIGHIAHFNLKPYHIAYGTLIGEVLLETNPSIKVVVNKVGQVKGKYRTYDYQILSSSSSSKFKDNTAKGQRKQHPALLETTVSEHGISIQVNIADCYWCTRLSGERQALLRDILSPNGNDENETKLVIADIFCGVGAQLLLLAKSNNQCQIKANDWNPAAIRCLKSSIIQNNLNLSQFELTQKDAYDFLMDLGCPSSSPPPSSSTQTSKARHTSRNKGKETKQSSSNDIPENQDWSLPDHILMNYPLEGPTFLGALRWWPSSNVDEHYKQTGRYPRFHIYTFASRRTTSSNKKHNDRQAEENAVDVIANELLPWSTSAMEGLDESELIDNEELQLDGPSPFSISSTSRDELDQEFDANVQTRMVRDVAPGKVVVLVSFSLTSKLVRYMQGSFSD